jgi:hypothetical protein
MKNNKNKSIMKNIYYLILAIFLTGTVSCSDYLDINTDPDNPSDVTPTPNQRLLSIQSQFVDCYESSGTRGSWITMDITKITGTVANDYIIKWRPQIASTTWPYQAWFVYTAQDLDPLIAKATAEEAWHYVGAAKLIYAWGFMTMLDVYGEMPMSEALRETLVPKYDDGKTIFYQCMDALDESIEYFNKQQATLATPLKDGDMWYGGDANKWIKLAYSLKARWLNNLSKKSDLYDKDAILDALSKGISNVDESCVHPYKDWGDVTYDGFRSLQHQNVGGNGQRMTKWKLNLLTNNFTGGSGVQDPRTTRMMPSGEFNINGVWTMKLTEGVDLINDSIRIKSGPVSFLIYGNQTTAPWLPAGTLVPDADGYTKDFWRTTSSLSYRWGDSVYLSPYSEAMSWVANAAIRDNDLYNSSNYYNTKTNHIMSTGTFYTRADAPGHLVGYPEMCFIKAEVLYRTGDKGGALTAYREGIRAHMELMNKRLATYPQDPGKEVITASEIDDFLASTAVAQNTSELTMSKIMMQKHIALSFSLQNWNDMRRFDYSKDWGGDIGVVYVDFDRPKEFYDGGQSALVCTGTSKTDTRYWIRRFQHCSHEVNYNNENWKASHPDAAELKINSAPVWWDYPTDDYKTAN